MLSYLPTYYESSKVMRDYLQSIGPEFDGLRESLQQILLEAFIVTATDRGLSLREFELGIPNGTGTALEERRSRLLAKLRGYGTANLAKVTQVAESFEMADVTVDDLSTDPTLPDYTIRITFINPTGIPANLPNVERALRAVVPAHLGITYVFNYLTWDELDAFNRTWDEWDALNLTWDEMEVLA